MTTLLMLAHIAQCVASIVLSRYRSLGHLRNLALPIGGGFLYSSIMLVMRANECVGRVPQPLCFNQILAVSSKA